MESTSTQIRVSVVVPTYNRGTTMLETVRQICDLLGPNDELILVDQTPEHPAEIAKELALLATRPNVHVLKASRPSSGLARNIGALHARGEYLLFLDDDVDPDPGLLDRHAAYYEDPQVAGIAGCVLYGATQWLYVPSGKRWARAIHGPHMGYRRKVFLDAGGMDTNLRYPFVPEEWELFERVRHRGAKIARGTTCSVRHRVADGLTYGIDVRPRAEQDAWFRNVYHNHFYWMFRRPWPAKILRLPYHFYSLIKFFFPGWRRALSPRFHWQVVWPAFFQAWQTARNGKRPPYWPDESVRVEPFVRRVAIQSGAI